MLFQKPSVRRFRLEPKVDSPPKVLNILRNLKTQFCSLKEVAVVPKVLMSNNTTSWINRTMVLKNGSNIKQEMINPLTNLTSLIKIVVDMRTRNDRMTLTPSIFRVNDLGLRIPIKSRMRSLRINHFNLVTMKTIRIIK